MATSQGWVPWLVLYINNLHAATWRDRTLTHIYQPVMLMALLKNKGSRSAREIAKEFLKQDESQIEYYEQITKQMPAA
jgi:hypothetical protein